MTEIILKDIFKSYDQTEVIHGVDLKVESGKFLVLVGPSGCGKSTLLRIIAGLERITSGEILIDGNEVSNIPASERGLAMVFQSYALYPHMSVFKNMAFALENLKIDKKTIEVDTEKFETNQKGIYAVGDICNYPGKLKLILSGFHEGALAARACFKLARPNEKYRFEFTTSSKTIKNRLGVKSD